MRNGTGRKIVHVEVLVEYAWIREDDVTHPDKNPGWSMTCTPPVALEPGESVPMKPVTLHPLPERDDGHFLISTKVPGYTRYHGVTPDDSRQYRATNRHPVACHRLR